ncbi:phage GP46 family protein [Brevibacillus borstelensis]|uniref:phage GP46 family protein n=1 Tax=Brevibacillus borstelensis TaxID=45462 RepID=UPI0004F32062|nr:phage GP46 family protein [Brevibacillus borstelensis]KKX52499.1 hypothetical protein X546_25145 [Brevibacillus borstelensis cifa_chp40]
MDPIINYPSGYTLDDTGNLKKWRTPKEKLKQRLINRLFMRRGIASIPGYEDVGSKLYTLGRVKRSEKADAAKQFAEEALQPEVELGEITRVATVLLTENEQGKYSLAVAVELPGGEMLDLEVSGEYGN